MRLVEDAQEIVREVVEQRRRRLAFLPATQMPRVVLDALAKAHLLEHLEVEHGPLLEALSLEQLVRPLELLEAHAELVADGRDGLPALLFRRHVVRARIDRILLQVPDRLTTQRIHEADALDLVAPELDADRVRVFVRREDLHGIAAHAEGAAVKVDVVALVLQLDEATKETGAQVLFAGLQPNEHLPIPIGASDAVDATHRRHDDRIATAQERARGRMTHAVDGVIDDGVLLDISIGRRNVRFRLIVVVIADEVLHRIVREELFHFAIELRCECLVRRHDERRPVRLRDHVRDGEGLAAAGDAEQGLVLVLGLEARRELGDGLGLISLGREVADELEGLAHESRLSARV